MTTPDRPDAHDDPSHDAAAHDDDAEDRLAILRRRAVFIASAVAGLGVAGCSGDPRACLDVYVPPDSPDAGADSTLDAGGDPVPCLSIAVPTPTPDAGEEPDAGDGDAGTPQPRPRPCLKVAPRPCLSPPRPCLDMAPPSDPNKP